MKKILIPILSLTAFGLVSFTNPSDKTAKEASYAVDAKQSKLVWHAKKVTGEHSGTAPIKQGSLILNDGKLKGGNFEISLKDLTVTDITDPEYNAKLVGHLKNDDFFAVDKHPVAKLQIVSATPSGANKYDVKGKLTIKGVTNDITFPAEVTSNGKAVTGKAKIAIDRTKYDIKYNSKSVFSSIGDKAIDDVFNLDISLVAAETATTAKAKTK
ncbi:YceI family protein [Dyadobacter luteus]|jgi:polyisoprenoid-binding protein YceI|uniref:YceI family protein n=1 Tax=Dyadobacter luteus TaxID=2259619 RepID=A0A3D8YCK0_9BACT|nr:YceI family protein [Dyadobacter luteus]REA61536.1 YceI family protein [Dyadobacter luteus]